MLMMYDIYEQKLNPVGSDDRFQLWATLGEHKDTEQTIEQSIPCENTKVLLLLLLLLLLL